MNKKYLEKMFNDDILNDFNEAKIKNKILNIYSKKTKKVEVKVINIHKINNIYDIIDNIRVCNNNDIGTVATIIKSIMKYIVIKKI